MYGGQVGRGVVFATALFLFLTRLAIYESLFLFLFFVPSACL